MIEILNTISGLISTALPVLVSIGVLYFIYGVIVYFIADDEEAKQKGRDRIVFGIIGLAVIVSVWGLVGVLNSTFGLSGEGGLVGENAPTSINNLVTQSSGAADGCTLTGKLQDIFDGITCIIGNSVIPLLFSVAVVGFIWGAIKFFIIDADEESKREQGRQFMMWGIIALAVMISVWGLVGVLTGTFGISNVLPTVGPNESGGSSSSGGSDSP